MAKDEMIKKSLFVAVLTLCVILIGIIWIQGIREADAGLPGYYRDTVPPDESSYPSPAAADAANPPGTPRPAESHGGHGRGRNHRDGELTPTPTIDWDAREEDQ